MFEVLCFLLAIQRQAKEIHYHAKGDAFWGDHLLADRIYEDLDGLIDEIQENYYLGREEEAPSQRELLLNAANDVKDSSDDIKKDFEYLDILIAQCIAQIESIAEDDKNLTAGDNDLLGRICSDLQKKHGFLVRRIK